MVARLDTWGQDKDQGRTLSASGCCTDMDAKNPLTTYLASMGDSVVSIDGDHLRTKGGRVYKRVGAGQLWDNENQVWVTRKVWVKVSGGALV